MDSVYHVNNGWATFLNSQPRMRKISIILQKGEIVLWYRPPHCELLNFGPSCYHQHCSPGESWNVVKRHNFSDEGIIQKFTFFFKKYNNYYF